VTSFFGIKGAFFAFFSKTTKRIRAKVIFRIKEKTLVHYNLHSKAVHSVFKALLQTLQEEPDIICHC